MPLEKLFDSTQDTPQPDALYERITFPEPPDDRPYLYINMASTVDGKIVIGKPGGTAKGVGGPTDQLLFRRLQHCCDACMIGSATLRASNVIYPADKLRFVVTRSGDVPLQNRFFTDAPEKAFVLAPHELPEEIMKRLGKGSNIILIGQNSVDMPAAMRLLRQAHGVRTLLCEGGATLNDNLVRAGLADELFMTLAPKIKGGAHLPTVVDGQGFPVGLSLPLTLLSLYRDADELYLRYRLAPTAIATE